jgi:predicted transcriptional regulator
MGDLSHFGRGQIVGARLAEEPVTKTATLLGVSRATVSKVISVYTNHGKTTLAKRNSWRKSTLTERDRRTSKNHTATAANVTGLQK